MKLPQEIQLMILQYLTGSELSAVMQCNTVFHQLGASLLYRTLDLTIDSDIVRGDHLLRTLLEKPCYCHHLRHIKVIQSNYAIHSEPLIRLVAINLTVIMSRLASTSLRSFQWTLSRGPDIHLLRGLPRNINCLELSCPQLLTLGMEIQFTELTELHCDRIYTQDQIQWIRQQCERCPLQKLSLCLVGRSPIKTKSHTTLSDLVGSASCLLSLTHIHLENLDLKDWPPSIFPNLIKLSLRRCVSVARVVHCSAAHYFQSLRKLHLTSIGEPLDLTAFLSQLGNLRELVLLLRSAITLEMIDSKLPSLERLTLDSRTNMHDPATMRRYSLRMFRTVVQNGIRLISLGMPVDLMQAQGSLQAFCEEANPAQENIVRIPRTGNLKHLHIRSHRRSHARTSRDAAVDAKRVARIYFCSHPGQERVPINVSIGDDRKIYHWKVSMSHNDCTKAEMLEESAYDEDRW